MKLKTETNTRHMEIAVLDAAEFILNRPQDRLVADFEHGQWWVTDLDSGDRWSAVDAAGGRSVNGFDFRYHDGPCSSDKYGLCEHCRVVE